MVSEIEICTVQIIYTVLYLITFNKRMISARSHELLPFFLVVHGKVQLIYHSVVIYLYPQAIYYKRVMR